MKRYDIVYCGSEYKLSRLLTSMDSILRHKRARNPINFHILDFNISDAGKERVIAAVSESSDSDDNRGGGGSSPKCQVFFRKPDLGRSNLEKLEFYQNNYNSFLSGSQRLYRLFLQDIFHDLDSCLFLSPEVVAKKCIGEVVGEYDFDGRFAIVSENSSTHKVFNEDLFIHIKNELEVEAFCKFFNRKVYFNPDIMLLNLKQMREREISQQFYAYALRYLNSPYKGYINSADGILRLGFEDCVKVAAF